MGMGKKKKTLSANERRERSKLKEGIKQRKLRGTSASAVRSTDKKKKGSRRG